MPVRHHSDMRGGVAASLNGPVFVLGQGGVASQGMSE